MNDRRANRIQNTRKVPCVTNCKYLRSQLITSRRFVISQLTAPSPPIPPSKLNVVLYFCRRLRFVTVPYIKTSILRPKKTLDAPRKNDLLCTYQGAFLIGALRRFYACFMTFLRLGHGRACHLVVAKRPLLSRRCKTTHRLDGRVCGSRSSRKRQEGAAAIGSSPPK